ncbi:MAG: hypothetical protein GY758_03815 [Fuerstiella sp.]|jgi:hypothetical protein|nr:hypothetical protein [Fuerstiella sp.]MCP4506114.1 hypothetical protein [Fuerstiella sp.]MDG2131514.1 hypothetical protein [Fuerstiella sp.]
MIHNGFQTAFIVAILGTIGCHDGQTPVVESPPTPPDSAAAETGHTHGDADKLVWVRSDIEEGEFLISLGHHGEHFHGGDDIEPAISISRGEEDVSDAVVYNSLVAEEGETVLCEEQATVFEPKTDEEPAHYAQGGLTIPKETPTFLIRFRIQLPGVEAESTHDITLDVSH